ncbi:uncharacterized protein METZ01_LOCUS184828 [marine metagenome]|uniref:Uncharacterized protein n=1 Tax=marine metagenome TaxID=408172 RepID=A0A382D1Q3_9ZZZZ|tara:strand:+ start:276 stop:554 length:279 start_codon:yes stop_codon:yes gene_type:complete
MNASIVELLDLVWVILIILFVVLFFHGAYVGRASGKRSLSSMLAQGLFEGCGCIVLIFMVPITIIIVVAIILAILYFVWGTTALERLFQVLM